MQMLGFNKFVLKVNNKLRKHLLGLPAFKGKVTCQELKFQLKVLVDRLIQRHGLRDAAEIDRTSEVIKSLSLQQQEMQK